MNETQSKDEIQLALHLADRALAPIFSSANHDNSPELSGTYSQKASALASLTNTAVTAHDACLRFGNGAPLRIMIETNSSGPLLLSSFLNPQIGGKLENLEHFQIIDSKNNGTGQSELQISPENTESCNKFVSTQSTSSNTVKPQDSKDNDDDSNNSPPLPPLLIASVVATSSTQASEARKAITRLDKIGRDCQTAWFEGPDGANTTNTEQHES